MTRYYVMEGTAEGSIVLLRSLDDTTDPSDGWLLGRKFIGRVKEPVDVFAKEDFEEGTLMPLYKSPPIMSKELHAAIVSAGVDNLEVWDAVVRKSDGTLLRDDYKAFNVVGLIRGAGPATVFAQQNPSRMVDASIESLDLVVDQTHGLLLFRLAESINTVIVHQKVKDAIEARGIENVAFIDPPDCLS